MAHPIPKESDVAFAGMPPEMVSELEPSLITLMQQSEALVALMREFFHKLDKRRVDEFKIIAGYIEKAKEDIREMRPHDIAEQRIPTAGAELEAITRDTEVATNTIMGAAETIMSLDDSDPKSYKAQVDDEVMKIFEACSFQDITGQRVSKVINVLKQIEERVSKLAETLGVDDKQAQMTEEDLRREKLLLHGPAIGGPTVKQNAIDDMFDNDLDAPEVDEASLKVEEEAIKAFAAKSKLATAAVAASVGAAAVASADDIDAMFSNEGEAEAFSQDDIDALFD